MFQADISSCVATLRAVLIHNAEAKSLGWLDGQIDKIKTDFNNRAVQMAFGQVPRQIMQKELVPSSDENKSIASLRKGFSIKGWTADMAARVLILLAIPTKDKDLYIGSILQLFETADMREQDALYAAFPLLAHPQYLVAKQAEGVRSNITSVFERIALNNVFSFEYLPDESWNQLVIKTIFIDQNINHIYGLDERRNYKLSRIARDLAHERWAAHRPVRPELWRLVVPFVDEEIMPDIKQLLSSDLPYERAAGLLLATDSRHPSAMKLVEKIAWEVGITYTWESLAETYQFTIWN